MLEEQADAEFGQNKLKILAELTRLRQVCCDPSLLYEAYDGGSAKREACMELISQAIEGGHRMLIFSQFTSMLELLEQDLKAAHIEWYRSPARQPRRNELSWYVILMRELCLYF